MFIELTLMSENGDIKKAFFNPLFITDLVETKIDGESYTRIWRLGSDDYVTAIETPEQIKAMIDYELERILDDLENQKEFYTIRLTEAEKIKDYKLDIKYRGIIEGIDRAIYVVKQARDWDI